MKKAIIIGGTSGIGLSTAQLLHSKGYMVGIAGRRGELLNQISSQLGERVATKVIDVCKDDAPERLLALSEEMGGVDLIFLAAGIGWQNPRLEKDVELTTCETNVLGFTRMITCAYRYFAERGGGHIAAITSIAGTKGLGAAPAYSATKRYQNAYIQCLAQQSHFNGKNIVFTDIRPGFVATDLLKGGKYPMQLSPDDVARKIVKAIEHKRRKVVIDWKYAILTALWRLIPDCIWERMNIKTE